MSAGLKALWRPSQLEHDALLDKAKRVLDPGLIPELKPFPEVHRAVVELWLRWSVSGTPLARKQWEFLSDPKTRGFPWTRDVYVERLWLSIAGREAPNSGVIEHVRPVCPWSYYERHFFGWFLSRFEIQAARGVFTERPLAREAHLLLAVAAILGNLLLFALGHSTSMPWGLSTLFAILLLGVALALFSNREPRRLEPWAFVQSLSPRLGAGVGIGYLFLASAPHLVRLIYKASLGSASLGGAALLGMAFGYLMHHIARRVHPRLEAKERARRAFHLLAVAIAYAAAGLLVAAPLFFQPAFLDLGVRIEPCLPQLFLVAAVALNLGVILQLAWDEKPLTEPL